MDSNSKALESILLPFHNSFEPHICSSPILNNRPSSDYQPLLMHVSKDDHYRSLGEVHEMR